MKSEPYVSFTHDLSMAFANTNNCNYGFRFSFYFALYCTDACLMLPLFFSSSFLCISPLAPWMARAQETYTLMQDGDSGHELGLIFWWEVGSNQELHLPFTGIEVANLFFLFSFCGGILLRFEWLNPFRQFVALH